MAESSNVMTYLETWSSKQPDNLALAFAERSYTYAEVEAETNRLAYGLSELGVKKGDSVCLLMPNCAEFVFMWFALARIGAISAPVNGEYTGDRLARLINLSKARVVVSDARFDSVLTGAIDLAPQVHTIIRTGSDEVFRPEQCRVIAFSDFGMAGTAALSPIPVRPNDPLMLVFTSGSTGEAKAVELSHGYALFSVMNKVRHMGYCREDVFFTCLPLFHASAALETVLPAIILGTSAAVIEKFSASQFWEQIRRFNATVFVAVGAMQGILLKQPPSDRDRDHRVQRVICGAVHDRVREFEDRFGIRVLQYYGSTECGSVAFNLDGKAEPGLIGRASENHEIIVADEDDRPVPIGMVGQLLVRPKVPQASMTGYFGDGAETARVWRNLWYHTGDLGYSDSSGTLHFAGRAKDVIRRRGRQVAPAEIETVIRAHRDISDCAAIGVPSELSDEEVKIVLEPIPGAEPSIEEIMNLVHERLPRYMYPRYIEFVDEIPKLAVGKVDKSALRKNWQTPRTIDVEKLGTAEASSP
ncbi:AMP-binding protein [Nocardia sp. NPDC059246]|uniref:AMP-binding protein n=1 Tax=unclassified Nocardia TaxID=2637762 RepID=UPI0036A3EB63